MPQRRTALKEHRKNRTRHMHNLDIKSDLRKALKAFTAAAQNKKADPEQLKTVYKKLDKAAKRNVMHKKTAARRKSRFAKMLASSK